MEAKGKLRRVGLLDDIRGICVLYIVAFHAFYDLVYIFGLEIPLFNSWLNLNVLQPSSAGFFSLIAGVASNYSKNNFKRGLKVFGLGLLITIISIVVIPQQAVRFGVLSVLGSSMLIYALLEKIDSNLFTLRYGKYFPAVMAGISVLLFMFTYNISKGYLGIFKIHIIELPEVLYSTKFMYPFGFPHSTFASSDYFPLLPWVFPFICGANLGIYFKKNMMPEFFYKSRSKMLTWIGVHSLGIYILHQPILMGVFTLIFNFIL